MIDDYRARYMVSRSNEIIFDSKVKELQGRFDFLNKRYNQLFDYFNDKYPDEMENYLEEEK